MWHESAATMIDGAGGGERLEELRAYWPWMYAAVLAVAAGVGLVLWLIGSRLAHLAVLVTGFVLGGLGAMGAAALWSAEGVWVLGLGVGGAVAGVLLAWLLFRIWVGLSTAAVLAMVVPAAIVAWEGTGPDWSVSEPTRQATAGLWGGAETGGTSDTDVPVDGRVAERREAEADRAAGSGDASGDDAVASDEGGTGEGGEAGVVFDGEVLADAAAGEWAYQSQAWRAWWEGLNGGERWFLTVGAAVGAAVGLALGLLLPLVAVSVVSSAVGAGLMFFAARALVAGYAASASGWFPADRRGVLLTLALLTLLGVLVQWAIRRRGAAAERG